jgi:heat induced stress protein YflT
MTSPNGHASNGGGQTTGRTVVGLFKERSRAEDAIRDLKQAGFPKEQIGVVTRDREGREEEEELGKVVEDTAAGMAEGASVGAITGGVIGGLVGLIGSLLIPGLGPVVVGGVLASTLMGMGIGAATGGLIGALVGMGVPEEDARYFDAGFREGGTLVTVNAGDRTPEALATMQRFGADLGPSRYQGSERRCAPDVSYSGPERRLVGV